MKQTATIDVKTIQPTQKDHDRAEGLSQQGNSWFGNGSPYQGEADKMAKAIKDPAKMIRRAKAVLQRWGTRTWTGLSEQGRKEHPANPWESFKTAMHGMGFTYSQIREIEAEYYAQG